MTGATRPPDPATMRAVASKIHRVHVRGNPHGRETAVELLHETLGVPRARLCPFECLPLQNATIRVLERNYPDLLIATVLNLWNSGALESSIGPIALKDIRHALMACGFLKSHA